MDLHIKDVLQKYIQTDQKVGDQYYSQKIRDFWKDRFADSIVQRTQEIQFSNGKLTVRIESAPLRHELFINRQKIKDQVNEYLQEQIVHLVILK